MLFRVDNSQHLKEAFNGTSIKKSIGTRDHPEPIWVKVASLHEMVSSTYFKAPHPSACSAAALRSLATRRANLQRALNEYPAAKRAGVSGSDGKVRTGAERQMRERRMRWRIRKKTMLKGWGHRQRDS